MPLSLVIALLQIRQERQPHLLGYQSLEDPTGVNDEELSGAEFDEMLLDEFEGRVCLDE